MAAPGRGRGQPRNISVVDEIDERTEIDRHAQLEAARIMGIPESEIPVRGRGGFRQTELRTIPENIVQTRASTSGARQVEIVSNYMAISPMPNRAIHMYRIDFEPEVESASLMRFLFKSAARDSFVTMPIYDGAHECRSGQQLQDKTTMRTVVDARSDNRQYVVKIVHTGTTSFAGPEMSRIYNMQMKEFLRMMGYYSPQVGIYVNDKHSVQASRELMLVRGFRTSANLHDGGKMLMNLECAHKLMQRDNVLVFMSSLRSEARQRNVELVEYLRAELEGKVIVTSYNKRVYRIEDIKFDVKPSDTFERNGGQISFVDFYKQAHNITIRDINQPLLKVVPNNTRQREGNESGRDILLVPELCNIAGLTSQQRNDDRLKSDLIRVSQVSPSDRISHLKEFYQMFHQNNEIKASLEAWGYKYEIRPVHLTAHILPMTRFAASMQATRSPPDSWTAANENSADIKVEGLAAAPTIDNLVIVTSRPDLNSKSELLETLKAGFDKVGLRIASKTEIDIMEGDSASQYVSAIRRVAASATVAIIIMKQADKAKYDAIKKAASVEKGLITQVVTSRLLMHFKRGRSAATKIAIQIAAKIGGEPWWTDIQPRGTMVCGYDTYHDTTQRGRSYGAFVASLNIRFSRYYSKCDKHDRLDEISGQVAANVTEAINHYKKFNNNTLPERVVIYRDGVGEGQLEHVYRVEIKAIKQALVSINKSIKLTIVVVNKRIGARFYMRSNDEFMNPPPGTVIDHTVTRQERYDFYLISQSTRQGTVTPTYYNIIHDEAALRPEEHQKLAFKLCLMYYNWAGTVRVPAPCQYAHKLAYLCGEHLHEQPNVNLDDKLHFL